MTVATVDKIDSIVICEPTFADRDQIADILRAFYTERALPDLEPYLIDTGDASSHLDYCIERQLGALAKVGERVVGLCGWRLYHGAPVIGEPVAAELVVLYVVPDGRRNGIGERLCSQFLTMCRTAGYKKPRIAVHPTPESNALFAKLGFREHQRIYQPG